MALERDREKLRVDGVDRSRTKHENQQRQDKNKTQVTRPQPSSRLRGRRIGRKRRRAA